MTDTIPRSTDTRVDLFDAAWLPDQYVTASRHFHLRFLSRETVASAAFLDERAPGFARARTAVVSADEVGAALSGAQFQRRFVFHTAFCGSTLLTRLLQGQWVTALREPRILHGLSLEKHREFRRIENADRVLTDTLSLLFRPWRQEDAVIVKPTNVVNNLLKEICDTETRAILLFSSFEDFVLSCLKKRPASDVAVEWMAKQLMQGTRVARAMRLEPGQRFNLVESCAIAWFSQMERFRDLLRERPRVAVTLSDTDLLDRPSDACSEIRKWLYLPGLMTNEHHADSVLEVDSKSGVPFNAAENVQLEARMREQHRGLLEQACQWVEATFAPIVELPGERYALPGFSSKATIRTVAPSAPA